jgi:phosphatidylglycerol:prolipoprotein diacylglycerol transferase
MYDCATPGLILGQIIGRWGNFVNGEAYGICESYSFFGKTFDISEFSAKNPLRMTVGGTLTHPTFLYESLWNLLGFVLMNVFFKKKAFAGITSSFVTYRAFNLFHCCLLLFICTQACEQAALKNTAGNPPY